MNEDWDNLIILDACRFDSFADVNFLEGELSSVLSRGSNTMEFLTRNFGDDEFPSTVYVSAHVNLKRIEARFHDRIRLFKTHREPVRPELPDSDYTIVFPEVVTEEALKVHRKYPQKRLIVHFLQPHAPLIGDNEAKAVFDPNEYWYEQLQRGKISKNLAELAYKDNILRALPHVSDLVNGLEGKTVITADHGELMGERGVYSHPAGMFIDALVTVPWLEIDPGERKRVTAGSANAGPLKWEEADERQLRDLGYLE